MNGLVVNLFITGEAVVASEATVSDSEVARRWTDGVPTILTGTLFILAILCLPVEFFLVGDANRDVFEEDFRRELDGECEGISFITVSRSELNEAFVVRGRDDPDAAALPDSAERALGVFRAPFGRLSECSTF